MGGDGWELITHNICLSNLASSSDPWNEKGLKMKPERGLF